MVYTFLVSQCFFDQVDVMQTTVVVTAKMKIVYGASTRATPDATSSNDFLFPRPGCKANVNMGRTHSAEGLPVSPAVEKKRAFFTNPIPRERTRHTPFFLAI